MLFNSLQYAIFLPIVFTLYWILPHKWRWVLILASSYYFYMNWNAKYLLLIVFITGITYIGSLLVEKAKSRKEKSWCVGLVVFISLALLFVFKYFNFFGDLVVTMLSWASLPSPQITLSLLLPVGISFYTFQAIGYIIDVYRGDIEAEHHFGKYASFVSFFPQLVAGPIERTSNLLPQLRKEQFFSYEQASYGLKLMAWGYFKKIVVADTLGAYVDKIYGDLHFFSGSARFFVIFFFAIQIYCDFSGYSDIARGTSKLFGIELMENFKSPYFSTSIKEFWRRWHISLSTWFKDYVYIPLGGNRVSHLRNSLNLMITFLLSGLWHGASMTFVVWGGLHGVVQVSEKSFDKTKLMRWKKKLPFAVQSIINFVIVSILWVFFRAQSIEDALYTLLFCFNGYTSPMQWFVIAAGNLGIGWLEGIKIVGMLILLGIFDYLSLEKDVIAEVSKWKTGWRWLLYVSFIVMIFLLSPASSAEFIYFDF